MELWGGCCGCHVFGCLPWLCSLRLVGWSVGGMGGSEESRRRVRWSKTHLFCSAFTFTFWFGILIGRKRVFNLGWGDVNPNLCSVARPQVQHFHSVSLLSLPSETATLSCFVIRVVFLFLLGLCMEHLLPTSGGNTSSPAGGRVSKEKGRNLLSKTPNVF